MAAAERIFERGEVSGLGDIVGGMLICLLWSATRPFNSDLSPPSFCWCAVLASQQRAPLV